MKKQVKAAIAITLSVLVAAALVFAIVSSVNGELDVISSRSIVSFDALLNAAPTQVAADASTSGWTLTAPDATATLQWSGANASGKPSLSMAWDAAPFIAAGLDTTLLPEQYIFADGKLSINAMLSDAETTGTVSENPLDGYKALVGTNPGLLNYHGAMDHFGLMLDHGNMFEWANSLSVNTMTHENQDKDIVFVLHPEPLIKAGVDPEKVEGWAYAQVETMQNHAMVSVYKFLKPFDVQ